jgi:transposase
MQEMLDLCGEHGITSAAAPAFKPLPLDTRNVRPAKICVNVRRADQSITVSWPTSEAAQCAAWLRDWLA